jgi:hypothetical protein
VRRTRKGEVIAASGEVRARLHADNEGWVREFVDQPLTRTVIAALLAD